MYKLYVAIVTPGILKSIRPNSNILRLLINLLPSIYQIISMLSISVGNDCKNKTLTTSWDT